MSKKPQQIVITPEQITALAIDLAQHYDGAHEYTEAEWIEATENYVRRAVNRVLFHASELALGPRPFVDFEISHRCDWPGCNNKPLPSDIFCQEHRDWENAQPTYDAPIAAEFEAPEPPTTEEMAAGRAALDEMLRQVEVCDASRK